MLIALIIVIGIAFVPATISVILGLRARKVFQENLRLAADSAAHERMRHIALRPRNPDAHYVDGMGIVIGDITCQLNARSPFIRCATNPFGPCDSCRDYEGREYD